MRNADKPITPVALGVQNSDAHIPEKGDLIGLTKREYFAAMALQGTLSNPSESDLSASFILKEIGVPKETTYVFMEHYPKYLALLALKYSDALLAELEKPQP